MSAALLERSPADTEPFRWAPLLVVLTGTFMTFLDFFIVNVALPSLQADLGAGPDAVQLVVAGYGLAFAVGMISGGRLGDIYGRRRMFTAGLALFTLTSLACGLAPDAETLVTARVLQGVAGALLTPQVLAIIGVVYAGRWRARAFAGFGFAMGIAGVLGQLLGGVLISADIAGSGWRAIFLINVPVGLVSLLLVGRFVPESRGARERLDLVGTELATLALVAVVLPLVEGQQHGWPAWTWASFAAAPLLLAAFVWHQARRRTAGRAPLVDLGLFRYAAFTRGLVTATLFGMVPAAFFFVLALYLQDGRGFSPVFSGVVFVAVGVGYFAALLAAEAIAARLGRQVLAIGAVAVALGCAALGDVAGGGSSATLLPGLAAVGLGIGLVLVPLAATVLADVGPAHAGAASGLLSTVQQVGAALGVAITGAVYFAAAASGAEHAFVVSVRLLAVLTLATAAVVQTLPRPDRRERPRQVG